MKHKYHIFNKFVVYINMYLSEPEFQKIWGKHLNSSGIDHLWNKYKNEGFLSFFAGLTDANKDILIDYLDINA